MAKARSLVAALLIALLMVAAFGCASTRELESEGETKSTIRDLGDELPEDDAMAGGSDAAAAMQTIIDKMLASDDACAILTQKVIEGYQIDPTSLASTAARQVLASGVVDVYNHLIAIVNDDKVRPPLTVQRDTFTQVLDLVDRYAANPASKTGNDQIKALVEGQDFVSAANGVSAWTYANCS